VDAQLGERDDGGRVVHVQVLIAMALSTAAFINAASTETKNGAGRRVRARAPSPARHRILVDIDEKCSLETRLEAAHGVYRFEGEG